MNSYTRLALFLGLRSSAVTLFAACDDGEGTSPGVGLDASASEATASGFPGFGVLELEPFPMYSAYVEGHESQLPVRLSYRPYRNMGAKFSTSDPAIATVVDTPEGGLITVKREGTVFIGVTLNGDTGKARLIISRYSEAQWKLGEARYNNNEPALVAPDGGVVNFFRITEPGGRNPSGSCVTCHTQNAPFLKIEDTPTQTAAYSDEELIGIITTGTRPTHIDTETAFPAVLWGANHTWTVTEEEKLGLVAYLRTKAPKAMPPVINISRLPCRGPDGGAPTLCDNQGNAIVLPVRDAGSGARVAPVDAGVLPGIDAGMAGDAG